MPGVGVWGLFVMEKSTRILRPSSSIPFARSFACVINNTPLNPNVYESFTYFMNRSDKSLCQFLALYLFCVICVLKVDKGKAPGAPRLLVVYDTDICKGAILGEDFPQIPLCGVQTQAKHSQTAVWVWISLDHKKGFWVVSLSIHFSITNPFHSSLLHFKYTHKSDNDVTDSSKQTEHNRKIRHVQKPANTYPVADMPAAIGHGGPTVAPAPAFSTVGPTARATSIGSWAGARSAVVSAWATMGMGPV